MILVCNRIPVNPEFREAFEQRFRERQGEVDGMSGFIAFQLLRPATADDPYVVMTYWETREHYLNWTNSEEFKRGHARSGALPSEAFAGHPKIEVFEVIQSTAQILRAP